MASQSSNRRAPIWLRILRYAVLAVILIGVLFGYQIIKLYTDWQWFRELHQASVFNTILQAKLILFIGFGVLFFLIVYPNLWLARRLSYSDTRPRLIDAERDQFTQIARRLMGLLSLGGTIVAAFLVGGNAATHWSEYLLFTRSGTFGVTDPIFNNDVGFYVFRIPFLAFLQSWFVFALMVTLIAAAAIHYSARAIEFATEGIPTIAPHVRKHLLAIAGFAVFAYAWGYILGRYDLLTSDNGAFFGAGYTDVHARLTALNWQAYALVLTGVFCFANIFHGKPFRLPVAGAVVWLAVSIIMGGIRPGLMQKFEVAPNQLAKEQEYILHDLHFTQLAYGLTNVKEEIFPGTGQLSAGALARNAATIGNIRLWDWPQLGAVYNAKQALATYYRFNLTGADMSARGEGLSASYVNDYNIDVDRYRFNNNTEYRQVMLGARELFSDGLPQEAKTWQNQHLQYTHGYGLVMSPVNRVDSDGLPEYFMSQIPEQSSRPELKLDKPQVYYGELANDYIFVDSKQKEFDYTSKNGNEETRYNGKGGIPLGGTLSRTAWSIRLGDMNMLFSSDLSEKSRILFRRNVRERVQALAPFMNWDNDPYIVLDNGRMVWILDGYTVTDRYPYSKPTGVGTGIEDLDQTFNYIRNSIKAVVDAYDGTVTFYVMDAKDPIIQTWQRIFPGLLTDGSKMSDSLRAHLRYPEDLFRIQRDIFTVYHISDPAVYYRKEDQWAVPKDPTPSTDEQGNSISGAEQALMMPYYVIMRLPGETKEEFLIMTPFTPWSKQNIAAWMCAKCDPEDYGQLIVYRFPRGSNVNGPQQIISQVKIQPEVSQFQTLIGQKGSKVIYGNLLVIPVESSLLYAIPLYIQATDPGSATIPEIARVIVASGDRIVLRNNLEDAVAALGQTNTENAAGNGNNALQPSVTAQNPGSQPSVVQPSQSNSAMSPIDLVHRARDAYDKARIKQQEYNKSLDDLGKALQDLQNRVK